MSNPKINKFRKKANLYRKVADQLWDLAREYSGHDMSDIGSVLKGMSDKLHDLAREHEAQLESKNNKKTNN